MPRKALLGVRRYAPSSGLSEAVLSDPGAEWREAALCLGMDTNVFFPTRGEEAAPAKAICAQCPVISECLDYALAEQTQGSTNGGVFGGTTQYERRNDPQLRTRARRLRDQRRSPQSVA